MMVLGACSNTPVEDEEIPAEEAEVINEIEGTTLRIVATSESYQELFDKFTEETGVKIESLSMSSGELLSRTEAEEGKPMAEVWFGGGLDAFLEAKSKDMLEGYLSPSTEDIPDQFKDPEGYWVAKGLTVVGFIVNNDIISEKSLPIPETWEDLADPIYEGEVIMSNPAISGTNYAVVNSLLQNMGEEKGWEYFEKLNMNIPFYGKRGSDPQQKVTAGEFAIGITYIDKNIFDLQDEYNVSIIYPTDGIPWVPEGMAIFKNSDNLEGAKAFIDWVFTPEIQKYLSELDGKDKAMMVKPGIEGLDLGLPSEDLMELDLSLFGTNRESILERWVELAGDK